MTTGQVRKYGAAIAQTEFSATNGGRIVGTSVSHQVAKGAWFAEDRSPMPTRAHPRWSVDPAR